MAFNVLSMTLIRMRNIPYTGNIHKVYGKHNTSICSSTYTCPTCTTAAIINLEPCELNAEFQDFILRLIKFPYFANTTEKKG
jgi:hypothetical protein